MNAKRRWITTLIVVVVGLTGALPSTARTPSVVVGTDWPTYTHDTSGSRFASGETTLNKNNVSGLHVLWTFHTPAAVHGTPAVVGGVVYAADADGFVYAFDASTGTLRWATPLGTPITSSPAVTGGSVIVGDIGGTMTALERATGRVMWQQHPTLEGIPAFWGSPQIITVHDAMGSPRNLILAGISGTEEHFGPPLCCSFRGSVVALDPVSGAIVWQTYTISDADYAAGARGVGIWSTPTYDEKLGLVFVDTGNNYIEPATSMGDAIIALDAATGRVVWHRQMLAGDTWNQSNGDPSSEHPDADFGDSPQLFTLRNGRRVVSAGQKNGFYSVLDARTGALIASTKFVPGGPLGGFFADAAFAYGTAYLNSANWPDVRTESPMDGSVSAITMNHKGKLVESWRFTTVGSPNLGGVAVANGVVYFHSSANGNVYALDAQNGKELVRVPIGVGLNGPAISQGRLFIGTGDFAGIFFPVGAIRFNAGPPGGTVVAIGL